MSNSENANRIPVQVQRSVPPELAARRERYDSMGLDALKQELSEKLRLTADHFDDAAYIVLKIEEKGGKEELEGLRLTLLPYLRKIAYGLMSSQALYRLIAKTYVLDPLSRLPLSDQRKLLQHGVVLGVREEDGTIRHSKAKPLEALSKAEADRVFDPRGDARGPEAQIAYLRDKEKAREFPPELPFRFVSKEKVAVTGDFVMQKQLWQAIGLQMGWMKQKGQ